MIAVEMVECVVVGAGVVGLAIAREQALAGWEVVVIEAEDRIGMGTSSRNSEVIHAGIYYPKSSLKTQTCVAGRRALYAYCKQRGIPHCRLGKLIVACTEDEVPKLHEIKRHAAENGLREESADALIYLNRRETEQLEPSLSCHAALLSRSTGIIDSHALMLSYQADAEAAGALIALKSPVLGGEVTATGFLLSIGGADPMTLAARIVINSAGLYAPKVARLITGIPSISPQTYFCKGVYFRTSTRAPFSRLIYPLPNKAGLGIHLTFDLTGQARFGPDTEWIGNIDYTVDPHRGDSFYAAVRKYWPGLPDEALQPDYAGIRPKISGPDEPAADFAIQGPAEHGVPGLVNLYGIESPGLTASLAIAKQVEALTRSRAFFYYYGSYPKMRRSSAI